DAGFCWSATGGVRRACAAPSRAWRPGPRSPGCRCGRSPRRPARLRAARDRPSRQLSAVEPSVLPEPLELVERPGAAVDERGARGGPEISLIARVIERGGAWE